ncbi:MAG: hypothetical protein V1858_02165 [Candidatus Gottesmanbacteria bacterium]
MTNKITPNIKELEKAFNGDLDLMLFYLTWIKNGLNASKAYKELHPGCNDHSARVLGSTTLAKISKTAVMQAYGLDHELYFQQLRDGVKAERRDQFSGEMYPDHKTRKEYHQTLGKLLGIETDQPIQTNIQVNVTRGENNE